jgi:hypothetical protein
MWRNTVKPIDSRRLRRVTIIFGLVVIPLVISFIGGPAQGYYRSRGLSWLDGESTGYLRLLHGQAYAVNTRKSGADCFHLGSYSVPSVGHITLFDDVNTNIINGRVTLWGIRWENEDLLDRFMFRSFTTGTGLDTNCVGAVIPPRK